MLTQRPGFKRLLGDGEITVRLPYSRAVASTDLASALIGFQGDDYVRVGNQLVIVDAAMRRVVAIIPEGAPT